MPLTLDFMTTYYVCHGPDVVHYVEVAEGSAFETGQPNSESFTDETAARARAEELGYVFTDEDEDEDAET